jgi:hypothetical protein
MTVNAEDYAVDPKGAGLVRPVQQATQWATVIEATYADDADTETDPDDLAVKAGHHVFNINGFGTMIMARLAYDDAVSSVTADIVVEAFGRTGGRVKDADSDEWMRLPTRDGSTSAELTIANSTDHDDGASNFTQVDKDAHVWDLMGCDEVVFKVATALNTNGDDAVAYVEAKII